MSKNVICVAYVYGCLFRARSQSNIDKVMNFSKSMDPVITGNTERES